MSAEGREYPQARSSVCRAHRWVVHDIAKSGLQVGYFMKNRSGRFEVINAPAQEYLRRAANTCCSVTEDPGIILDNRKGCCVDECRSNALCNVRNKENNSIEYSG